MFKKEKSDGATGRDNSAFTLIELIAVIVVLAVLAGVAVPRFMDHSDHARDRSMKAVRGAVRTGLASVRLALATGQTVSLPDTDQNGHPDHLGDTGPGEATLFDGLLDPPLIPEANGWKQNPMFPWNSNYGYFYDTNGNGALDLPEEGYLNYVSTTGVLASYLPPSP